MSSFQEGSSLTPLSLNLIPLTPPEGSVRHQKSSLPQEGQLGLQAPWDEVQRSDFQNAAWLVSIYYFLEVPKIWTSIPNMSWALEAQSNTLQKKTEFTRPYHGPTILS